MKKDFVDFTRNENVREQKRVFIIATEGEKTEKIYFDYLKNNGFLKFNVIIRVLNSKNGYSSPKQVLARLKDYIKKNKIDTKKDKLWLVIDRDRGSNRFKDIIEIYKICRKDNIGFAFSNPCFELWFLIHKEDVSCFDKKEKDFIFYNEKKSKNGKSYIESKLSLLFNGYNKKRPNCYRFVPYTKLAVINAKKLIIDSQQELPDY
jgi:hypothetical protein